jgi:hypothetical protein
LTAKAAKQNLKHIVLGYFIFTPGKHSNYSDHFEYYWAVNLGSLTITQLLTSKKTKPESIEVKNTLETAFRRLESCYKATEVHPLFVEFGNIHRYSYA